MSLIIQSKQTRDKVNLLIKIKPKDLGVSTKVDGWRLLETLYGGKTELLPLINLGKEYPIIVQQYLSDRRNSNGRFNKNICTFWNYMEN